MAESDYYKVLGVSREATADEIRRAYKKLARENHPDMKPNDKAAAERFKEVQEAYGVLSDPTKREQYDRYGSAFKQAGRGGQAWTGGGAGPIDLGDLFGSGGIDLGDLFGGAGGFGGGRRGPRPMRGRDVTSNITVPFLVAAEGGQHEIQVNREGKVERLSIKIPAGVPDGGTIRLAGQGEPGMNGGPPGDLLIGVRIAPHPHFRRDGNNLLIDLPVTPAEAALGAKIEVPTLTEGNVLLTVPPGTSSGAKLRLRGKGIPDQKTRQRGDQFAIIKIVVPRDLSPEARELYERLSSLEVPSPRQGLW